MSVNTSEAPTSEQRTFNTYSISTLITGIDGDVTISKSCDRDGTVSVTYTVFKCSADTDTIDIKTTIKQDSICEVKSSLLDVE